VLVKQSFTMHTAQGRMLRPLGPSKFMKLLLFISEAVANLSSNGKQPINHTRWSTKQQEICLFVSTVIQWQTCFITFPCASHSTIP